MDNQHLDKLLRAAQLEVLQQQEKEASEPLTVCIFGEMKVGKSSLINSLFNTDLPTGVNRATTKKPTPVSVVSHISNHSLNFIDFPGTGESEEADETYMEDYIQYGKQCDIIFWCINSENKSVVYGVKFIERLLSKIEEKERLDYFNKIVFVITKVDCIRGGKFEFRKRSGLYTAMPDEDMAFLLEDTKAYFKFAFMSKLEKYYRTEIYVGRNPKIEEPEFQFVDKTLVCNRFLNGNRIKELRGKYPKKNKLIERIIVNQSPIPCSVLFKYNLIDILSVVVDKTDLRKILKLSHFINLKSINKMTKSQLDDASNMRIID
jgi:GTP-binding protein EngB required for normal cell division